MSRVISFDKRHYNHTEPLIIYGASVYGEIAYHALCGMGIFPDYFCDQMQEKSVYYGIPIININDLKKMSNANVIIASADYFSEIKKILESSGNYKLFDMIELLNENIPNDKLSNRAKVYYANKQRYIDMVQNSDNDNAIVLNRVQYVVSERCSLRCKDCTHLMQYYQHPRDVELEKYKNAFDMLLDTVQVIAELRILGGEPFMNKEMYKVIDWYYKSSKIKSICIYTNGTIIPDNRMLQSLQKEKVKVHISDYGVKNKKVLQLADVLEEHKIRYFVRKYDDWQDAGNLDFRGYDQEYMQTIFGRCFERNCITFLKGELHRCPRSAHAMNLGAMPIIKEDFVDLQHWEGTKSELAEQIKKLMAKSYIGACNYCDGLNNHLQSIPAAIQTEKPLYYKKMC